NMSVYTWWYIRRSYGLMTEDGQISKRGYCMAQYSKFVRPGDIRIGATETPEKDVYVSAYKNDDNQVTIVAVNKSANGYSQQFSIDSGESIVDIDRYRTSANENIALTENLEYTGSSFWAQLPAESVSTFVVSLEGSGSDEPKTDENGYYFHDTFEGDTFSWKGRGEAEVTLSGRTAYAGAESLLVQGRTSAWHGASKILNTKAFKPGGTYSFSVDAMYFDGDATDTLSLKLQYTGADGETHYPTIAQAQAIKGEWVQLANTSFTIPEDASDMVLYVETPETTNNFYIDEAIGAPEGTKIDGPAETAFILGDVNDDGVIDIFDLGFAKRGVLKGFSSNKASLAADVDQNGKVEVTDLILLQKYIHHLITEFPKTEKLEPTDPPEPTKPVMDAAAYMAQARTNIVDALPQGADVQTASVDYGTMQSYTYYSTTRERVTPVNVLLPAGYNENEKYPVLYMLHGYWETQDTLSASTMGLQTILGNQIAKGEAEKMIVVFPYIYTSKTQEACSGLNLENSLNYDNFINDLKADLMPWVESTFSVKTGRENTAVSGFSMGGRESQFIGLSMSDTFGYVGAVCPAPGLTPGYDLSQHPGQLQESDLKFANAPYLFLLSGAVNDSVVGNQPEAYHNIYTKNNVDHIWNSIPGGGHDGNSIRPHFYNLIRNLFKVG
ncbi:MAG: carbohydrate binding domain-containing protein, partial [Oscillospiraceae bacterium]|nr:carbohydrate binding domain-containing protein [Oscillospiraceae bacterium]